MSSIRRQVIWLLVAVLTTVGLEVLRLGAPWPFMVLLVLVLAYAADTGHQALTRRQR